MVSKRTLLLGNSLLAKYSVVQVVDLFSESLASLLKYVDDVVIGHHCRDSQGVSITKDALKYIYEWEIHCLPIGAH